MVSLIRLDIFTMIFNDVPDDRDKRQLIGLGGSAVNTLGKFATMIEADGMLLDVEFQVVSTADLNYEAIIGTNVLNTVPMLSTNGKVTFLKNKEMALKYAVEDEVTTNNEIAEINEQSEWQAMCLLADAQEIIQQDFPEMSHLSTSQVQIIYNMINEYTPIKKLVAPVTMKLILIDEVPVTHRPRKMSYEHQLLVNKQVEDWLQAGIIRDSVSEYAAAVVLVRKKDGTYRLCCDYRKLNAKIVRDNFPMVLMDDVIERLQGAKVYTTLDLANGFFHVPVDEGSKKYTSFVTHNGQYEFEYVPFGLSNSPAVFMRYVMSVFRDLIQNGTVVIYMDDLIIATINEDEGIQKLSEVLKRSADYGLQIKWKKCQILQKRVNFLGYVVEGGTVKPSEEKTSAIKNYPMPTSRKAIQRFLGLTSYFRRFLEGYAMIAKPLSDLLRKDVVFKMEDKQIAAFEQLKALMMRAPVLQIFNPLAETEIHTDACQFGYGAILLQKNCEDQLFHPVQYMSRKTKPAEEKYPAYELEVLAIIAALKKWRTYVLGMKIRIVTDCIAVKWTMNKPKLSDRVERWIIFLQDFQIETEQRSGSKMQHVDALSRVSCLLIEDTLKYRLKEAQQMDDWTRVILKLLENETYEDFYINGGILFKNPDKELIVVPNQMEDEIIQIAHRQGHFSAKKTQELVEKAYYIPKLKGKCEKVTHNCVQCLLMNEKTGKKEGVIQMIPKEDQPMGTLHVDHVGPMDATKKIYSYILVVVDAFSKFVWLYPTKNTGAEAVVERLRKQSAIFGNPRRIITDRGAAFISNLFKNYCTEENIEHLMISTGVPRGNGQVERVHRMIIPMLAKLSHPKQDRWYIHVDKVQQIVNNTPPRSTKISPYQILTGVPMRIKEDPNLQQLLNEELIEYLSAERNELRQEAKRNISINQQENKKYSNAKRKEAELYVVADLVSINRIQYGTSLKLQPKYFEPYKVTRVKRHDRYERWS